MTLILLQHQACGWDILTPIIFSNVSCKIISLKPKSFELTRSGCNIVLKTTIGIVVALIIRISLVVKCYQPVGFILQGQSNPYDNMSRHAL